MELYFDGQPLKPIRFESENFIIGERTSLRQQKALRYLWGEIKAGREYVSLARMSRKLGYSYDDCERLVAQAHVDRKIPRLAIVEEMEG